MTKVSNARGGVDAQAAAAAASGADDVTALAETHDVAYDGHVLTLKKPGVLAGFRLVRMLEPEVARNGSYVDMISTLLYAHKLDGALLPFPQSEREIEGLITRLGEEGMGALMLGIMERWGKPNAAADQEAVKN